MAARIQNTPKIRDFIQKEEEEEYIPDSQLINELRDSYEKMYIATKVRLLFLLKKKSKDQK